MPTYVYRCKKCGTEIEVVQSMSDPPLKRCRTCRGALKRVFQPVGIVLKGPGFHKTDYAPKRTDSGSSSRSGDSSPSGGEGGSKSDGGGKADTAGGSKSESSSGLSGDKTDKAPPADKPSSKAKPPKKD